MITRLLTVTVIIAFFFANSAIAQTVSGKIIDNATKEPIQGASIKVIGT